MGCRVFRPHVSLSFDLSRVYPPNRSNVHSSTVPLIEAHIDTLIAMKIAGHADYQTTANIYTHVRDEMLKKSIINRGDVFRKREE